MKKYELRIVQVNTEQEVEQGMEPEKLLETHEITSNEILACVQTSAGLTHIQPQNKFYIEDGKFFSQHYRNLISRLKEVYSDELSHIVPDNFMILEDTLWELTDKTTPESRWGIKIKKCTADQRRFTGYEYEIKVKTWWLEHWERPQIHAAFLSQLLKIDSENMAVRSYSENFENKCMATFGSGYLDQNVSIPDCLETKVELKHFINPAVQKDQVSLDELEAPSNVIDFSQAE